MNDEDISHLEKLCSEFYHSHSEQVIDIQQRNSSGQALYGFLESPANFRSVFSLLSITRHSQLLYLAVSSITKMLNSEWKTFSLPERSMIYENLFSMLFNTQDKPAYLTGGIAKALARVCRFGWNELEEVKQVTLAIERYISQNASMVVSGFKFYEELITEIGEPIKGRSLSLNRKIAVSFRDEALGSIFTYSLTTLANNMQGLPRTLLSSILTVVHMCMSFDFLGISTDETSEDTVCLQIPMTWKGHFENPVFFGILEFIILNSDGDVETLAIRVFNHMGAIRKSIFSGSLDFKQSYVAKYLKVSEVVFIRKVLQGDSLFEFIQAVKRFLSNFGLKEVAECEGFDNWVQNFANFSLQLFRREEAIVSGIESSMFVWNYLAYEGHHQLNSKSAQITQFVTGLFKAFLEGTLSNITANHLSSNNEADLKDHIENISSFSLYYYVDVAKILEVAYLEVMAQYDVSPVAIQPKFAWLITLASGFIALRDGKNSDIEVRMDAILIQLVFQTISKVAEPIESLETSCLLFFGGLSKAYINSSYDKLWSILDNSQISTEETINKLLTPIMEKCFKNLSLVNSERITKYSLELFEQLAKGYYSNKYLVKNEMIQNLMMQYKTYPLCLHNSKLRYRIFNALTHLWMNEDLSTPIETFLSPMSDHLQVLIDSPNAQQYEFIFRELEGVAFALQNQKSYLDFFEWFYYRFNIIMSACQNFLYDDKVMDSMLKFVHELVFSRNTRIRFDNATPYGIVLFKNLSSVINGYGKVIIENSGTPDFFKKFYNKIRRLIGIMYCVLSGGYVSFGVFEVYADTCFVDSLRICFAVLETIPRQEIASYVKILDTVYDFLELLCKSHLKTIFTQLSSACYSQTMLYLINGVRSPSKNHTDMKHCVCAANSTGHLCEYIIKVGQKEMPETSAVQRTLSEYSLLFTELFEVVLEVIVLEDSSYMWSLSKPLLGLIIVNEHNFENVKRFVIAKASSNTDTQSKLYESLSSLMNGVSRGMDVKNRDRFAKNFSSLRQVLSSLNN